MRIVSTIFKHLFKDVEHRIPKGYSILNLNKTKKKRVNTYDSRYTTSGVSGNFTRVYIHDDDNAAIHDFKKTFHEKYSKTNNIKLVVKHPSISFKFFYGKDGGKTSIVVTSRAAGTTYPFYTSKAVFDVESLKSRFKVALKMPTDSECFIQHMIDVFIYKDKKEVEIEALSHLLISFKDEIKKEVTLFESRNIEDGLANGLVNEFQSNCSAAIKKTDEWKEVNLLQKQLKEAKQKLLLKTRKIERSHSKINNLAQNVTAWRREGSCEVSTSISNVCKCYSIIKARQPSADLEKELCLTIEKMVAAFDSYSEYPYQKSELKIIFGVHQIPENLIMAISLKDKY